MQASLDRPGSGVLVGVLGALPGWQWGAEETTCPVQLQCTNEFVSLFYPFVNPFGVEQVNLLLVPLNKTKKKGFHDTS